MELAKLPPIPGFEETDWLFDFGSGCEDPETGEWLAGRGPGYFKRYVRHNAFPGAPDGKTSVSDVIFVSVADVEANPNPEAIAALIQCQREVCEMSLRDLFEQKGVPFPDALSK